MHATIAYVFFGMSALSIADLLATPVYLLLTDLTIWLYVHFIVQLAAGTQFPYIPLCNARM